MTITTAYTKNLTVPSGTTEVGLEVGWSRLSETSGAKVRPVAS